MIPKIKFGICPDCGADAGDDATPTSADAPARDTTGSGVPLFWYEGRLICQLCVKRYKADNESMEKARKIAEEDRFRAQVGFDTTVS